MPSDHSVVVKQVISVHSVPEIAVCCKMFHSALVIVVIVQLRYKCCTNISKPPNLTQWPSLFCQSCLYFLMRPSNFCALWGSRIQRLTCYQSRCQNMKSLAYTPHILIFFYFLICGIPVVAVSSHYIISFLWHFIGMNDSNY